MRETGVDEKRFVLFNDVLKFVKLYVYIAVFAEQNLDSFMEMLLIGKVGVRHQKFLIIAVSVVFVKCHLCLQKLPEPKI